VGNVLVEDMHIQCGTMENIASVKSGQREVAITKQ